MGDISPNFSRYEFACRCGCGHNTIDAETLTVLETLRTHFGEPVSVNSGNRCAKHNKAVGGASNSQHLYGRAADINVDSIPPNEVAKYLEHKYPAKYGIGRYRNFTHIDTRSGPAVRWRGDQ